ncbi:MAG TPA: tetratricopeptide repeat protein [Allosphingosinicella sp.]|nr:tetratricopeptide repeat protein [Allosphingosinicella sp.]
MKSLAGLAMAAIALGACSTSLGPTVEAGYPTGSLAVAAIERADWATAERLLTDDRSIDRENPARLINLGRVYAATGRTNEAVTLWQRALAAPVHVEVQTADGRIARTDQIAREAIALYGGDLQTAAVTSH